MGLPMDFPSTVTSIESLLRLDLEKTEPETKSAQGASLLSTKLFLIGNGSCSVNDFASHLDRWHSIASFLRNQAVSDHAGQSGPLDLVPASSSTATPGTM